MEKESRRLWCHVAQSCLRCHPQLQDQQQREVNRDLWASSSSCFSFPLTPWPLCQQRGWGRGILSIRIPHTVRSDLAASVATKPSMAGLPTSHLAPAGGGTSGEQRDEPTAGEPSPAPQGAQHQPSTLPTQGVTPRTPTPAPT